MIQFIRDAQSLLHSLEDAAEKVGLFMNATKTEFMTVNIHPEETSTMDNNGDPLVHAYDSEYLGSYILESREDFKTIKGMSWTACIKLLKVWTSRIYDNIKVKFFRACAEPVLLY